ncbi:MAG: methyltransferase [Caulobacteraceae bacterium]
MGRKLFAAACAVSVVAIAAVAWAAAPAYVTSAVADAARPQADKDLDAARKPTELLTFTGLKPGDKIIDIMPGRGYTTHLFSKVVGAKGKVYAVAPAAMAERMKGLAGDPAFPNITVLGQEFDALSPPEKVDVVWTSQNYHDFHNPGRGGVPGTDIAKFNKAVYDALKPGGVFVITDHNAGVGAPVESTRTMHRIAPDLVKKEVTAAGFVLAGESDVLANPKDDPKVQSEGPGPRNTDKFVLKFRKPA